MHLNKKPYHKKRITTALLLAAGTGSRLFPLTKKSPKCLTLVNKTSILERLIKSLNQHGFKRLVIVTGHMENCIRNFLETRAGNIKIEYVFSPLYKTTNNIYSLWMARKIINEPFVLIPDRIAIARMKPWLDGSTVTINSANTVDAFHGDAKNNSKQTRYKTVNIYSLSVSSWHRVIEKLDQYILAGRVNDYYEAVFRQMVIEKSLSFQAVFFDHKPWCEIDTIKDLESAEKLFPARISKPLSVYDIEPDRLKNSELYARKPLVTGSIYVRSSL
ncbi:MAG: phosphocholine cytidylyltransferase family protein [Deltaproteobacteria bacterium]|nr:phosphocholine cytidylyltransferase family protein [Deltaproteobacteria bacterium]